MCPESLAIDSAEWTAPASSSDECAELAAALNEGGASFGDADGDCPGRMTQSEAGGMCRVTLASTCDGVTFELDCDVRADRTADCSATIEAPELAGACTLRVALR